MATEATSEQVTITTHERTWRVQIECALNSDYVLQAFRETVRSVDGIQLGQPDKNAGVVSRTLSEAAADRVTLTSGKTVTIAELAEALVKHIEAWRTEDLTPEAPEEPTEEEAA